MKLRFFAFMMAIVGLAMGASAGEKKITVKNAHDFIKALGPNRTIVIATSKPLNITDELEKMIASGEIKEGPSYYNPETASQVREHITYDHNTDGYGLQVRGFDNLTIKGKGKGATLLASPRYVNVMEFINCNNLMLENITMGHTQGGYCDKGVLELDDCLNVTINDCDFFGCGTEGFVFELCDNVTVNRSCVHDCTYHTMHVRGCNQVRFNDCVFRKNMQFSQINIGDSQDVDFTGCVFDSLEGELFNLNSYQNFYCCTFRNCAINPIDANDEHSEFFPDGYAILGYCMTMFGDDQAVVDTPHPDIKEGIWTDGAENYEVKKVDPYRYVFSNVVAEHSGAGDVFAVNCMSAVRNEYICAPVFPYEMGKLGRLCARVVDDDGHQYLRINDDGGEIIKSFFYIGKN